MPIENRELAAGTRLVARHKGEEHVCEVVQTDDGLRYRLGDRDFNSPSSAGRAVTGGVAVNGWRFWSLGGTLKERKPTAATSAKKIGDRAVKPTAEKGATKRAKKPARKVARTTPEAEYGCGVCSETFPTMKAATKHALTHTAA